MTGSLWAAAMLFAATFVQEDAAILGGGYLVDDHSLSAVVAFLALYGGVVAGDLAIYGLGLGAARLKWLNRLLERHVAAERRSWLERHLWLAVAGSHLAPTLLFPTFLTCGALGLSFRRFALAVVVSASLYVPLMFGAVLLVGGGLARQFGLAGWAAAVVAMTVLAWVRRRQGAAARPDPAGAGTIAVHDGMPPLARSKLRVALHEIIPPPLYYIPVALQWLWLAARHGSLTLPSVADPMIEAGGLMGESKSACLAQLGPAMAEWTAIATLTVPHGAPADLDRALAAMAAAGLDFPCVAKPDIGWRGFGVRKVAGAAELARYLAAFPAGAGLILQQYLPWHGEAGVFVVRRPGRAAVEVNSLTFRYFPFVIGDGRRSLRQLVMAQARTRRKAAEHLAAHAGALDTVPRAGAVVRLAVVGSSRVGGLYVDARAWITPALRERFQHIADAMPEFHFGRFDVRFAHIDSFQAGRDFKIVEVNGGGAEAIHMWDPDASLFDGYRDLFAQQALLFDIAAANRARGYRPLALGELVRYQRRQNHLTVLYPASG